MSASRRRGRYRFLAAGVKLAHRGLILRCVNGRNSMLKLADLAAAGGRPVRQDDPQELGLTTVALICQAIDEGASPALTWS